MGGFLWENQYNLNELSFGESKKQQVNIMFSVTHKKNKNYIYDY